MKGITKILLVTGAVLIAIQFVQPARNQSGQVLPTDISRVVAVPDTIEGILKRACYDCHSNHTVYPWYANIQPVGWLLSRHIKEGKEELNFSEFGSYTPRRQKSKLRSIENSLKDGTMPLSSYMLMHKNARLSSQEKSLILDWLEKRWVTIKI